MKNIKDIKKCDIVDCGFNEEGNYEIETKTHKYTLTNPYIIGIELGENTEQTIEDNCIIFDYTMQYDFCEKIKNEK